MNGCWRYGRAVIGGCEVFALFISIRPASRLGRYNVTRRVLSRCRGAIKCSENNQMIYSKTPGTGTSGDDRNGDRARGGRPESRPMDTSAGGFHLVYTKKRAININLHNCVFRRCQSRSCRYGRRGYLYRRRSNSLTAAVTLLPSTG